MKKIILTLLVIFICINIVQATNYNIPDSINARDLWGNATGVNITIAIIDSGIDYTNVDLGNCSDNQINISTTGVTKGSNLGNCSKIIGGYNFVNSNYNITDSGYGHGTQLAGIIAGSGINISGVAPDAKLASFVVFDSNGNGNENSVISALGKVIDPNSDGNTSDHYNIAILSMEINSMNPDEPLALAVDNAINKGVIVVSAAGDNAFYFAIKSPGTSRYTITAGTDTGSGSSKGPTTYGLIKPDVVAGAIFYTTALNGSCGLCSLTGYKSTLGGTSYSTPVIGGMAALVKGLYPSWTPLEIKMAIRNTADITHNILSQGHGKVNATNLLDYHIPPVAFWNVMYNMGDEALTSYSFDKPDYIYIFDNVSGSMVYDEKNHYNPYFFGTASINSGGINGSALNITAGGLNITGMDLSFSQDFTQSMWIKLNGSINDGWVYDVYDLLQYGAIAEYGVYLNGTNLSVVNIYTELLSVPTNLSYSSSQITISPGVWYNLVLTMHSNTLTMYINNSSASQYITNTGYYSIGHPYRNSSMIYPDHRIIGGIGLFDEVYIWKDITLNSSLVNACNITFYPNFSSYNVSGFIMYGTVNSSDGLTNWSTSVDLNTILTTSTDSILQSANVMALFNINNGISQVNNDSLGVLDMKAIPKGNHLLYLTAMGTNGVVSTDYYLLSNNLGYVKTNISSIIYSTNTTIPDITSSLINITTILASAISSNYTITSPSGVIMAYGNLIKRDLNNDFTFNNYWDANISINLTQVGDWVINITAVGEYYNGSSQIIYNTTNISVASLRMDFANATTVAGLKAQSWIYALLDFSGDIINTNMTLFNTSGLVINTSASNYNFTSLPDGTYYLNATGYNFSGYFNITETRIIILDTSYPVMNKSSILPVNPKTNDTLFGYCNATKLVGGPIIYHYTWFKNNVLYSTGISGVFNASLNANIVNLSGNLTVYSNWTLQCIANDGAANSSALNSSSVMINNTAPLNITARLVSDNSKLLGYCNGSDIDNQSVIYLWNLYKDGILNESGQIYSVGDIVYVNGNYIYWNYTKLPTTNTMLWQSKHNVFTPYNSTIPVSCFDNIIQLRFYSKAIGSATDSYGQCYNGTAWNTITKSKNIYYGGGSGLGSSNGSEIFDNDWNTYAAYDSVLTHVWYPNYNNVEGRIYEQGLYQLTNGIINHSVETLVVNITPIINSTYILECKAYDFDLSSMYTNSTGLNYINSAASLIIIINPLNNHFYNDSSQLVNFSMINASNVWYNWNGTNYSYTTALNITFNQGWMNLTAYVNDSLNNVNSTNITFLIDTVLPMVVANSNTQNGSLNQSYWFFNITATDSNRDTVLLFWNGSNQSFTNTNGSDYWINLTGLTNGTYSFYAWANDSVGHISTTAVNYTIINITLPVTPVSPGGGGGGGSSVLINSTNTTSVNVSSVLTPVVPTDYSIYVLLGLGVVLLYISAKKKR